MLVDQLKQKAIEIANLLFNSEELYLSRGEFNNHLQGDLEEFRDLIREALCSIPKITKQMGRTGGIKFSEEKYRRSVLIQGEIEMV